MSGDEPILLNVKDLTVEYVGSNWSFNAVEQVSFALRPGLALGVVGESGCGKSTIARALLRLLPAAGRVTSGEVWVQDRDVLKLSREELRRLRWRHVSMIFQSSMNALNPVYQVRKQMMEAIRTHSRVSRRQATERVSMLLEMVGISADRMHDYPHQFSGGMRQRVGIAMALALEPEVIIADEPTTALDVITQDQILDELTAMKARLGCALLLITHDIGVVAKVTDQVAVMYAGRLMELGPTRSVLSRPSHPYTMGLRNAFPSLDSERELVSIPGSVPGALGREGGCRFQDRCPFVQDVCRVKIPGFHSVGANHRIHCHFPEKIEDFQSAAALPETWLERSQAVSAARSITNDTR